MIDNYYFASRDVKLQADRLQGNLIARRREELRGTVNLDSKLYRNERSTIRKHKQRSICSYIFGSSPFKDKFYTFFISHFDASLVILPFIFKRAGWVASSGILLFLSIWSYYASLITIECIRLLLENYKMRQHGVDFESLIANFQHIATHGSHTGNLRMPWLSKTLAGPSSIGIIKHLYLTYLILASTIGLVLCQYTADTMFEYLNSGTIYALQLMPEARVITESKMSPDRQPFAGNYFSISVGLSLTLLLGMIYGLTWSFSR